MFSRAIVAGLLLGLALETVASPVSRHRPVAKRQVPASHVIHERHAPHWSSQWTKREKVAPETMLPMRIGLKQPNLDAGHDLLMEISSPGSARYGQHMSAEEVIDFFAPHSSSITVVNEWLVDSGIAAHRIGHSANKQWIQFDATADEVEELLFADFYVWEHASGDRDLSTEAYHIPVQVQEHIDYITPGTRLRSLNVKRNSGLKKRSTNKIARPKKFDYVGSFPSPTETTCDVYITADCIRAQYGVPNATTAAAGNELGIFESLNDHYNKWDLDVFFSTLYPHIPNGTYPEERLIDGAVGNMDYEPGTPIYALGVESSLDFDAAWPLIYPQKTVLFQEDDQYYEETGDFMGFWNTFLDAIDGSYCTYSAFGETGNCNTPECQDPAYPNPHDGGYKGELQCGVYKPTNVISVSYGYIEYGLPDYYLKRQCNEWMKLGLQGTTVVFSSGDSGVGDEYFCPFGRDGAIFVPDFVASCPYVLAVGSTEWNRFDASAPPAPYEKLDEVPTTSFASGGGFSNVFGIPSYQRQAVDAYFDQVKLPFSGYHHYVPDGNFSTVDGGLYHHGGRAYPDVAAIGDRQLVFVGGDWWTIGGTSLSAPVWGAMLTLINEERIAAGKSTVGFVHPVLYSHPEVFNDITVGSNPGCYSEGFPAAKGWDPVSGLGSPNFPALRNLLLGL